MVGAALRVGAGGGGGVTHYRAGEGGEERAPLTGACVSAAVDREPAGWTELHVSERYRHWSPRLSTRSEPQLYRRGRRPGYWDDRPGRWPDSPAASAPPSPRYYSDQPSYNSQAGYDGYDSHAGYGSHAGYDSHIERGRDEVDDVRYDHDYSRHVNFADERGEPGHLDDDSHRRPVYQPQHSDRGYHGDYDRYEHEYAEHERERPGARRVIRSRHRRSPHTRAAPSAGTSDEGSPVSEQRSRRPRRSATRRHTISEGRRSPESDTSGVIFIDNGRLLDPAPSSPAVPPRLTASDDPQMGSERVTLPPLQPSPPRALLEYARMERPKRPSTDHPRRRRRSSVPAPLRPAVSRIPVPAARRRTARVGRSPEIRRRPASGDTITEVMVIQHPAEVENNAGNPGPPPPLQISESASQVAEAGAGATGGGPPSARAASPRVEDAPKSPVDFIPRRRRSQVVQKDRVGALLADINGWDGDGDPYSTEYRQMYKKKEGEKTENLKPSDAELMSKHEFAKDTSYLTEFVKKDGQRPDQLKQEDAEFMDRDMFEKDTSYQSQYVTHPEDEYRVKGNARPGSSLAQTGEFDAGGHGSRRQSERSDGEDGGGGAGGGVGDGVGDAAKDGGRTGGEGGGGGSGGDGAFDDGDKNGMIGGLRGKDTRASKDGGWINDQDVIQGMDHGSAKNDADGDGGKGAKDPNAESSRSRKMSSKKDGELEKTDNLSTDETKKWASRDASRERREQRAAAEGKADGAEESSKSRSDREREGARNKDKQGDKSKGRRSDKREKSKNRANGGRDATRLRGEGRGDDKNKIDDRGKSKTERRAKNKAEDHERRAEDRDRQDGRGKGAADKQDEKLEHSDTERETAWSVTFCALDRHSVVEQLSATALFAGPYFNPGVLACLLHYQVI